MQIDLTSYMKPSKPFVAVDAYQVTLTHGITLNIARASAIEYAKRFRAKDWDHSQGFALHKIAQMPDVSEPMILIHGSAVTNMSEAAAEKIVEAIERAYGVGVNGAGRAPEFP